MRVLSFLSCWLIAGVAAADVSEAERLFAEAQKLRAEGRFELACVKLEQSLKADWALGSLLYLADCYERTGRLASANEKFRQAQIDAVAAGDMQRVALATQAMQALEPRLAKLQLIVDEIGAEIMLDGRPLPRAMWEGVAVDPGEHEVTLLLPGGRPIARRVRAPAEGQTARIELGPPPAPPPARPLPPPSPAPSGEPEPAPGLADTHIAAIAMGAFAVAGTAIGTALIVHAKSTYDASAEFCTLDDFCEDQGLAARNEARDLATGATIAYAGAGAAAAAMIALLVAGATHEESTVGVAPGPPGAFGVALRARW